MTRTADSTTNVLAAASIGILQLGVAISLAALIFDGPLEAGAGRAASGFVLGTAIVSLIVGATSKMSVVTAGAQDTAAVMVAAVGAAIVSSPELSADEMLPTVVVMIALAGIASGIVFWILGRFSLTEFVRFLPFPVIAGFTAGTGWLLLRGGFEVMRGEKIELGDLGDFLSWSNTQYLLPGLALALTMVLVVSVPRLPNTLVSVAILGGTALFHVVGRSISSFNELEARGWLIGPFTPESRWAPVGPNDFGDANWRVLADNTVLILAVVAVAVIGLLLNLSSLEGDPDSRIDMSSEARSSGAANLVAGLGGGLIGYHLLGDTLLARQIGARSRTVPLIIGAMATITFLIGPGLIAQVPRSIAGGVLAGLGISMLITWARQSIPRMNRSDQLLSVLILVIIGWFGVLSGVGAGVAVAVAIFIVKYSRIDPVRYVIPAAGRSTVDRDPRAQRKLTDSPDAIMAFQLQGYLFFGSTTGLRRQIERRIGNGDTDFVILDFSHVTGIDSTAAGGLLAIETQLQRNDMTTAWSGLRSPIHAGLPTDTVGSSHSDLDHAIAWCEDRILEASDALDSVDGADVMPKDDPSTLGSLIDRLELPRVSLMAGDTLISAGDNDSDVYFVESGTLSAWLPTDDDRLLRIRRVLPGAALGEIAFCTGAPRTATVKVDTDATIRILRRDRFDAIAKSDPALALVVQEELLRRMGNRVASTSAMVRNLLQ